MDEPIVWMEGRLDRRPHVSRTEAGPRVTLTVNVMTGFGLRQYRVRADGTAHLEQVERHHAGKGTALILRGVMADEDDGCDVLAVTLAVAPSQSAPVGGES